MAEFMTGLKRTDYCGDLRTSDIGREVTVCGWVQRQRDLGQLIFIDLRDRTGIVQLAFDNETDRTIFEKAFAARSEYVLAAKGVVRERSSKNMEIPTGEIEVEVKDLRVLSKAETPPFEILDETNTNEELRLKYRYLDLRRGPLQRNIMMRSKIAKVARDYFYENGFIEIETPMMMKSTPEGARDYLVPSRVHKGKFYALPQSPQIYKQLLMVAGYDRYIQLARCFRDEDLRADRQPEFTQIDMELSFVDMDEIMEINEGLFKRLFKDVLGQELETPFPRMTYKDAMERYGSDKPDIRFGMEICDISELAVDEVIDLYYHGGSYDSFHGFSREVDGRNVVFLYFDRTLRSDVMPNREGHLCIGNGLLTDFETATYQVDRQVDAVYYLVGDYLELPGLAQSEFEQAVADAVLLWER